MPTEECVVQTWCKPKPWSPVDVWMDKIGNCTEDTTGRYHTQENIAMERSKHPNVTTWPYRVCSADRLSCKMPYGAFKTSGNIPVPGPRIKDNEP